MGVTQRGGVFYVKWRGADGIWRRRATTCRTRGEANKYFSELVTQAERQRRGLEARPIDIGMSLGGLCQWWLDNRCPKASRRRMKSLIGQHVRRTQLGALALNAVSARAIEAYYDDMERKEYAPRSINLVRLALCAVFTQAKRAGLWAGDSPAHATEPREVSRTPRPVLKPDEVALVISKVAPSWRNFFACAAYLGLRKGELCGVLKEHYDPIQRTLYVGRSYAAEMTKGKRVDYLPVTDRLAPFLEAALKTPGPHLFPGPKGKMRGEYAAPEDILRVALRRAGLVEGFLHKCRRCVRHGKKSEPIKAPDDEKRRCPKCGYTLWPVAIARPMRFHDIRHTAATHLLQAGVPVQHVQRILRHSSIATTVNTYGHLMTEDLRPALENLGPRPVHPPKLRRVPTTA